MSKLYKNSVMPDPRLEDFRVFLYKVWEYLALPEPTMCQLDISRYLQDGPRRRMVQAFRGVGKSWITVAFVGHQLMLDPQKKIEVVSATGSLSEAFTNFCLQLIHGMPLLAPLIPHDAQRKSRMNFDVGPAREAKDPSVKCAGINGQITGTRADLIVADDIEIPANSETQLLRDKLAERIKEFDMILKPGGEIIYLGTPQCEDSLYNKLPERGYDVRIWPAEIPKITEGYHGRLGPCITHRIDEGAAPGSPTDPQRFTTEDLLERRLSQGKGTYALQFMLDTSLSDANRFPLKVNDLITMDLDPMMAPEHLVWGGTNYITDIPNVAMTGDKFVGPIADVGMWVPYQGILMAIDPSGRGKDELSWAIVAALNGRLYILDWGGSLGHGYNDKALGMLAAKARDYKVNNVVVESNFGDGMFNELFKPHVARLGLTVAVDEVRNSKQKEMRIIDTLEPVMNQHRLVIDRKLIEADYRSVDTYGEGEQAIRYRGIYQMTRITRDKGALMHDDRIDVLAIAVGWWLESMAVDSERAVDEHRLELLEKELEDFDDTTTGVLLR